MTTNIDFVDLKTQYESISSEIDAAVREVITTASFIGGRFVKSFESNFSQYCGVRHCIGAGNGTDALFIALKALGIGPGDEVITAANSFIATSEAITLSGARPVFIDCDEKTCNIDLKRLEGAITGKTRAIIPVHLYGQMADMHGLMEIARRHGLYVVEDAAQAHGATYKGQAAGTFGAFACFSFFPGKNLGAYGDAGAIVTNDDALAARARMYANHGRIDKYDHVFEGVNSRLDGLQAAILDVKLKHLERWTKRRQEIARIYDEGLKDIAVTPSVLPGAEHVYHLYVIRVRNRENVRKSLKEKGISTGVHYPTPLPLLKAYAHLGYRPQDFPAAYALKDEILSLPIYADMTDDQAGRVVRELKNAVCTEGSLGA
ncbi:MAG: DegT/DnrJ/EryC1/StrS family aminotransferase [Deltaproteobacteria bacterium]|nr:DegT/DnrJ/EryC1/StrS family aminotransferase [Deltaproteobacteria bacterium]